MNRIQIERMIVMFERNDQDKGYDYNTEELDYTNFYDDPNSSPEGMSSYVNIYSDPNTPKKSGGGKTFLKVVAALAALAIVSVSSIELYKLFGRENTVTDWSSAAQSEENMALANDSEPAAGDDTSDAPPANAGASWISAASPENALTIPQIVDKALPSVVGISSVFETERDSGTSFWGFNFYNGTTKQQFPAYGTGIVMTEDGYVVTNAHCIYDTSKEYNAGKAISVSVVLGDENETEYDAQIVGYDVQTDLAVLKIDASGLTPAEFGDSNALSVGELVVAIGNPLGFELFGTTTCGIVSALNRQVTIDEKTMTLIQTDAAINSGNSGGPLLNGYGQVIGINSAKFGSTYGSTSVEGLGFAIPISDAKDIIDNLINYGYVTGRPQLGISGVDIEESDAERFNMPQGVYVYTVGEGSAAELAGIRQGDVITAIEGQTVTTVDELNEIKNEHNAGEVISITIWRSGETIDLSLTLQEVHQEN